jgi:hypothetical protein
MRSRAVQLVLVMVVGAAIGLLASRNWSGGKGRDTPATPAGTVNSPSTSGTPKAPRSNAKSQAEAASVAATPPPPAREFKLPAVEPAIAEPSTASTRTAGSAPKRPAPTVMVPAEWLLRGSAPRNYDLRSDRDQVWSGAASALLKSHEKNISPLLGGSLMQTTIAEPYIGKRVELSAYLRAEDTRAGTVFLWFRAVDANNILLVSENTRASAPKVTEEWTRYNIVADVPWSATEVGYGVTLLGKGALWIDDAKIEAVDKAAIALTRTGVRQTGVAVQVASQNGPLPRPSNLGFEETVPAEATLREIPPDSIADVRF